jgi:hypothetical protein
MTYTNPDRRQVVRHGAASLIPLLLILSGPAAELPAAEADLFKNLPAGWKVVENRAVPKDQAAAIGQRLGAEVLSLSNTILDIQGTRLQVNLIGCETPDGAKKVQQAIVAAHGGTADCGLRTGAQVAEFLCDDLRLIKKAHYVLGLRPKRATYRITFDAAPVESGDWMSWNALFNRFLALETSPGDAKTLSEIETLSKKFRFADAISLRVRGAGTRESAFTLKPAPAKREVVGEGDLVRYSLGALPKRAGLPCVSVTATVTSEAFCIAPTQRKPGKELLGPTDFWPTEDAEVVALAGKIAADAKTDEEKVNALLEWMVPGRNIRFGGPVTGSRYGVKQVLAQGFGQCWDFSDCFVTLCRAAGVPCRQVAGWLYGQCGHIWAEVLLEGKGWQQVDPTAGMACGSDYIPYLTSERGDMPIVYLSMPKIEVLPER